MFLRYNGVLFLYFKFIQRYSNITVNFAAVEGFTIIYQD